MSRFDPEESGYIDVAERIAVFREKYPEGSLQSKVLLFPTKEFSWIAVEARAYRTPDDARPGVGLAWEPFPGKTPYTKDSELMVCETSAWGRALVACGAADTKRGIASKNEVQNRKSQRVESAQAEPSAASDTSRSNLPAAAPPAEPSALIERFDVKTVMDETRRVIIERKKGERVPFKVEHLGDVPDDVLSEVSRRLQDRLPV